MGQELRAFTVNMKSLDQDIEDPIIAGAGDANGMTFRIIFTQEAAAQFTPETKVYLKWFHQQKKIKGLNVFAHIENECYPVWEIHWPRNMLHEGDVLCNIEVVDDISITPSTNFVVHVLSDPNDGSSFVLSDDYTVFQTAVIELTSLADKAKEQLDQQKEQFEDMRQTVQDAADKANQAYELAQDALEAVQHKDTAMSVYMNEFTN